HHLRRFVFEFRRVFPAPFWHSSPSISEADLIRSPVRNVGGAPRRWCTVRSMRPVLAVLRDMRVIPVAGQPSPDSAVEAVLVAYRRYLMVERRLAAASVMTRVGVARRFMSGLVVDDE